MGNWKDHWLDYYEILGVEFGADFDLIKKKYRELARFYHPDAYQKEDGEQKIREINEAYEVLSNEEQRKVYDEAYLARLNNEYSTSNEESTPKYTEEEMKNVYNEEEIRYAKQEALRKIIEEELEKAKIIIDAKNELLYAAYQKTLDKIEYFETLKQFINSSNEYLISLNELQQEAYEYDLLEEQSSILEIKNYLEELLNELPTNLTDAEIFVQKEFIKEQLEEEIQNESSKVQEALTDLTNFYKSVFKKEISKIEFKQYKEVMVLNLEDAITRLENLLTLTKEDKKEMFKTIGMCKGYLGAVPQKYEEALVLGEKLVEQDKMKEALLSYQEVKRKLDKIMKIIKKYPVNKKVQVLYEYAKNIINQNRKELQQYINYMKTGNQDADSSYQNDLLEEALTISDEATKLFKKTIKTSKKAKNIYDNKKEKEYNEKLIHYLSDSVLNNIDEIEALKLFNKVTKLLAQDKVLNEWLHNSAQSELKKQILKKIKKLNSKEKKFDSVYFQINEIIDNFKLYNDINPQNEDYLNVLDSKLGSQETKFFITYLVDAVLLAISGFVVCGSIAYGKNNVVIVSGMVAGVLSILSVIKTGVEQEQYNSEDERAIKEEYDARKNYYDLKNRQYVFSK